MSVKSFCKKDLKLPLITLFTILLNNHNNHNHNDLNKDLNSSQLVKLCGQTDKSRYFQHAKLIVERVRISVGADSS